MYIQGFIFKGTQTTVACKLSVTSLVLKNSINTLSFPLAHVQLSLPSSPRSKFNLWILYRQLLYCRPGSASLVLTDCASLSCLEFKAKTPTVKLSKLSPSTPSETLNVIHYTSGPLVALRFTLPPPPPYLPTFILPPHLQSQQQS